MIAEPFDSGIVVISLDTELGWGRINAGGFDSIARRLDETKAAIGRLIERFAAYNIPATWALVGQLLEPGQPDASIADKPTVTDEPIPWTRDWWRFPTLAEQLRATDVGHEIACHSGSHLLYDGLTPAQTAADIREFRALTDDDGITSFVFPQHRIDHLDVLRQNDFECYRGLPPALGSEPTPTTFAPRRSGGLVDVPLSVSYRNYAGRNLLLRNLPTQVKVAGLKLGSRRAASTGRVFHVGLHPKDFALDDGFELLAGFEEWLEYLTMLQSRGNIDVLTMSEVAHHARWTESGDWE